MGIFCYKNGGVICYESGEFLLQKCELLQKWDFFVTKMDFVTKVGFVTKVVLTVPSRVVRDENRTRMTVYSR